jgi:hypothetical protein
MSKKILKPINASVVNVNPAISDKLISSNLKLWWTTKNLLIIRPKFPGDGYTASFSFQACELFKIKAIAD